MGILYNHYFSLHKTPLTVKSKLSVAGCLPVLYASKYFGSSYSIAEFGFGTLLHSNYVLLPVPSTSPCWQPRNSQRQLALSARVSERWNRAKLNSMVRHGLFIFGSEEGWLCCAWVCVSSRTSAPVKGRGAESLELSPNYFPLVNWVSSWAWLAAVVNVLWEGSWAASSQLFE